MTLLTYFDSCFRWYFRHVLTSVLGCLTWFRSCFWMLFPCSIWYHACIVRVWETKLDYVSRSMYLLLLLNVYIYIYDIRWCLVLTWIVDVMLEVLALILAFSPLSVMTRSQGNNSYASNGEDLTPCYSISTSWSVSHWNLTKAESSPTTTGSHRPVGARTGKTSWKVQKKSRLEKDKSRTSTDVTQAREETKKSLWFLWGVQPRVGKLP